MIGWVRLCAWFGLLVFLVHTKWRNMAEARPVFKGIPERHKKPNGGEDLGMRYPAISPNGRRVAFSYQGDIWVALVARPRDARRLTSHPAYDMRPCWSPDGRWLMFTSMRSGSADVYIVASEGGVPRRLTFHQAHDEGVDWSPDGKWLLFQSDRENVSALYRVSVRGGLPQRLIGGLWNYTYNGAWSPDGSTLLFNTGMEGRFYWWRKGYRGPNSADILAFDLRSRKARVLVDRESSELWPMWSSDGRYVYFVSDHSGCANLWRIGRLGGKPEMVTRFSDGSVRWPAIAKSAHRIVYERNFQIWETVLSADGDLRKTVSHRIPFSLRVASKSSVSRHLAVDRVDAFALSRDGKKLGFSMRGEVFVTDSMASFGVRRLTQTIAWERDLVWHPDNRHLLYVSDRGEGDAIYKRDAMLETAESLVLQGQQTLRFLRYSPDGKHLFYLEGKDRLMLLSEGEKAPRLLATVFLGGWAMATAPSWSPDSKALLYTRMNNGRGDIYLHPIAHGKKAIRLTLTAAHDADGAITSDGLFLIYRSNRHGSDWFTRVGDDDLYLLPLQTESPRFLEDKLDQLFGSKSPVASPTSKPTSSLVKIRSIATTSSPVKQQNMMQKKTTSSHVTQQDTAPKKTARSSQEQSKKPEIVVKVDPNGLAERSRRLSLLLGDEGHPSPAPKGTSFVFFSNAQGSFTLWLGELKEGKVKSMKPFASQVTFPHMWSNYQLQWSPDAKSFYVLLRGKIMRFEVPSGKVQTISLRTEVEEQARALYLRDFRTLWVVMRDEFYDAKMSGTDWSAIFRRYQSAVRSVQARQDWVDRMNEMLGELNASHLGVRDGKPLKGAYSTGVLGARIVADDQGMKLVDILEQGPLHQAKSSISSGVYLVAINQTPLQKGDNPFVLLRGQVGKRVILSLNEKPVLAGARLVKVKPIDYRAERVLRYKAWVRERRRLVALWSGDQIGYLHMRSMVRPDLFQFIRDFETELAPRKASIVDLRFNWGGNIHDRVLSFLERRLYGTWQVRGGERWQQPFFAVGHKPMAMLINEETLSDGEMTANGFRALRLGKLIGMPTYRWLIFTSSYALYDGLMFRLPFWICQTLEGKDLEKVGVEPHIRVQNTLMDRLEGRDPQLRRAVEELLGELKKRSKR